ncbi:uncharacterized protein LOC113387655 [Ctenocephalides felis]|uniref:uncharacterized protein LOC113387655 n=1 Tax=Ctenocephalides felis TaxID=7515 RepID=UPI000E6E5A21|nr:uncharacterized protein LOC113387655 [Ctenocephalides felis]
MSQKFNKSQRFLFNLIALSLSGSNDSPFEPEPIVDAEERERLGMLAQRDFLIRSYGLVEHIYLALEKTGSLRQNDERKYGMYARAQQQQQQQVHNQHLHQQTNQQNQQPAPLGSIPITGAQTARSAVLPATRQRHSRTLSPGSTKAASLSSRPQHGTARVQHSSSLKASLSLQCNELPMYVRKWPEIDMSGSNTNSLPANTNSLNFVNSRAKEHSTSSTSVPQGAVNRKNDSNMDINKVYQKIDEGDIVHYNGIPIAHVKRIVLFNK